MIEQTVNIQSAYHTELLSKYFFCFCWFCIGLNTLLSSESNNDNRLHNFFSLFDRRFIKLILYEL